MNIRTTTTARTAASVSAFALAATLIAGCGSGASDDASPTTSMPTASMPTAPMPGMSMPASAAPGAHAGHGAPSSSATASNATFNDADVRFVTMMYPHHAQAVEMADLVPGRDAGPDVTALADEIRAAQQPEMDAFTRLLAQWGRPAPSATMDHAMDGMMTPAQMAELKSLRGAAFDRAWLKMMIAHHEGAITMARAELADGTNPQARKIAEDIIAGQQTEIDRMRKLAG